MTTETPDVHLDDVPMLQQVAFHLRLSAREEPVEHRRDLLDGHARQVSELAARILAMKSPTPTAPRAQD